MNTKKWVSERYQVREGMVRDVLMRLQVQPVLDAFADEDTHVLPVWWGDGGAVRDAFGVDWGKMGVLWMDPPYSRLPEVVTKLLRDGGKAVMIKPD